MVYGSPHTRRGDEQRSSGEKHNPIYDDDTFSIELGRGVPHGIVNDVGRGFKESEDLSSGEYFHMDDIFKKDRDEFLKHHQGGDPVTQKLKDKTSKIIDEMPSNVASKYGDALSSITNRFIQEHLTLKSKYEELLNSKEGGKVSNNDEEKKLIIKKLTEKLKKYKSYSEDLEATITEKDSLIAQLKLKLQETRKTSHKDIPVSPKSSRAQSPVISLSPSSVLDSPMIQKPTLKEYKSVSRAAFDSPISDDTDYSLLIDELKKNIDLIKLEEEKRVRKETQKKEILTLKRTLEEMRLERERKNTLISNRDLDNFRDEIGDVFRNFNKENVKVSSAELDTPEKPSLEPLTSKTHKNTTPSEDKVDTEHEGPTKTNNARQSSSNVGTGRCVHCDHVNHVTRDHEQFSNKLENLQNELETINEQISKSLKCGQSDDQNLLRLISRKQSLIQELKRFNDDLKIAERLNDDLNTAGPETVQTNHHIESLKENAKRFEEHMRRVRFN